MRQIGTLPSDVDPDRFGDYLLSLGISSKPIASKDGWAIWVHDEDQLPRAREELNVYLKDPDDPRFDEAARVAEEVRREKERLDRVYRKNYRNLSGTWDGLHVRRRPLTMFLVAVCVSIFVAQNLSEYIQYWTLDKLAFFSIETMTRQDNNLMRGLDDIHSGQVWRLITPIFLHGGLMHLAFNMWAIMVEGTVIEERRGTKTLAVLVLLTAITSNIGQFLYLMNFEHRLIPWVGISGVGYGLFGYLWMKGRFEPEQGMILTPQSIRIMLIWLLVCFLPGMNIANGAHVAGLIIGMLFGLARF